ncbi:MAG TPA: GspH/FimT family pseudopilin [Candidatus Binatia bacterium]|nr:GspH/FimT family pseudopilin [Candidatus Binatia bacterium]
MISDQTKYCNQSGFTITELVIAIAIMSILAVVATPNLINELSKYRLKGAARQIFGDLTEARMKSTRLNRKVKVFFMDNKNYKICDDSNNDGTVDDCEGDAKLINIQDNYKKVTLDSNNNPIFSPRGTASNLATINVTNSSGTQSITIAITGRVKMN